MMHIAVIAIRNVLRNKRRSLFSALAMIIGVGFVVFLNAFFNGFIDSVIKTSIEGSIGAVQVHRAGFLTAASDPLRLDMPADEAFMASMRAVPGVLKLTPRITFEGLINNGVSANIIFGTAIDPVSEYEVCPQRSKVEVDGSLTAKMVDKGILGAELAASMDLPPGSSATVLGSTKRGASNALDITIVGRLESPVPFAAKRSLIVPLTFAQSLLKMQGRVTEYAVRVADLSEAKTVATALQAKLGAEYEVLTWDERDPNAKMFIGRLRGIIVIVTAVLFVLMLSFIVNAMLSAVYERVREIGTMLAVGVRRRQIMIMFLIEAMTLGLGASIIGSVIGSAVVFYFSRAGIVLTPPGSKPAAMYPFVSLETLVIAIGVSVMGAVLAALYPAFKASRLRPVEALRAN